MKKKKNRILSVSGAALCLFFPVLLAACSQEDALPRPLEVSAGGGAPLPVRRMRMPMIMIKENL